MADLTTLRELKARVESARANHRDYLDDRFGREYGDDLSLIYDVVSAILSALTAKEQTHAE